MISPDFITQIDNIAFCVNEYFHKLFTFIAFYFTFT